MDVTVEIEHRLDDEVAEGPAAPVADLVGGDQISGVLDPADGRSAGEGVMDEVQVEDGLAAAAGGL